MTFPFGMHTQLTRAGAAARTANTTGAPEGARVL